MVPSQCEGDNGELFEGYPLGLAGVNCRSRATFRNWLHDGRAIVLVMQVIWPARRVSINIASMATCLGIVFIFEGILQFADDKRLIKLCRRELEIMKRSLGLLTVPLTSVCGVIVSKDNGRPEGTIPVPRS